MIDEIRLDGLHQVAMTCADLDRSVEFYESKLGLPLRARFDPPGLAFFDVGGVRLSLQKVDEVGASGSVLYFRVADIEAATTLLQRKKKIAFEREPELVFRDEQGQFGSAGEEEWMAFFRDPDQNLLALVARK